MKKKDPDLSLVSEEQENELEKMVKFFVKQLTPEAINYLKKKGINSDTIEKFKIGFGEPLIGFNGNRRKLDGFFNNHLVFPFIRNGKVVDFIGMTMHDNRPKYKILNGKVELFYNSDALEKDDILLCRDLLDVLTLDQAGFAVLSVPAVEEFKALYNDELKNKRVFICFNNDEAGKREGKEIVDFLVGKGEEVYLIPLPEGCKSANHFFLEQKEPESLFEELMESTLNESSKKSISSDATNLEDFIEEYTRRFHKETKGIKTGFAGLDRLLLGGLRSGLYLIHGYVASGKTMFMRQMADQIAEQKIPVVFVSWDMTTFELWARSMARFLGVSPREVLAGKTPLEQVKEASKQYHQIADYLFTFEANIETSIDDVENFIEEIILTLGKVPVIFIDHFHRIPILDRDGKAITNNMALVAYVLHQWSRNWDAPIIISSPRENGGKTNDLTPTLEACIDVIVSFDPDDTGMDLARERIRLTLYKNRNGAQGYIQLMFDKEKAIFIPCPT